MALPSRPRIPRPYHHGDLKAAAFSEARRRLARDGFEAISLRAIAEKLGVAPNALYRHFRNKEALLALLAEEGFQEMGNRFRTIKANRALQRFRRMATEYVRFGQEHPETLRLMFSRVMTRLPKAEGLGEKATSTFTELLKSAAAVVGRSLESRKSLEFAIAAWSLVHGYATLAMDGVLDFIDDDRRPGIDRIVQFVE